MSAASEKAADRMHADLSAMILDAERHQREGDGTPDREDGGNQYYEWQILKRMLMAARGQCLKAMSARDRAIAERG